MSEAAPREHLAWLIWCMHEGYVKAEDRATLDNWLLEDPTTLHPSDAELRPHLLAMADEVLRQIDGSCPTCGEPSMATITDHICEECADTYVYCPTHANPEPHAHIEGPA